MALASRNTAPVSYTQDMEIELLVRINGTLPDLSVMGDEEKSERAAEVKKMELAANTSCSVFSINPSTAANNQHLLIDIGELINTMVFTHIPSNILLILVAFAPTLPTASSIHISFDRRFYIAISVIFICAIYHRRSIKDCLRCDVILEF